MRMSTLILLNKPFRVLSQFTREPESQKQTLADYITLPNVYPAGRLDYDSEGLLLLTDDGKLQHHIADPKFKLEKTYWVQVEGAENQHALLQLSRGVMLKDGMTQPAKVEIIDTPEIWERHPPVRFRQSIPTHWLSITISEGRNRQVRRMSAAVGLPTLRLVRAQIGDWTLNELQPGEYQQLEVASPAPKRQMKNQPSKHFRKKKRYSTQPSQRPNK